MHSVTDSTTNIWLTLKVNCKSLDDYLKQVFPVIVIAKIVQRIAAAAE